MKYFTICINGQKAVDAGYKLCAGKCYTKLCGAQIEVTIDCSDNYNGIPQKWVSASFIDRASDIPRVLDALRENGFDGCKCIISYCVLCGCLEKSTELYCTIV